MLEMKTNLYFVQNHIWEKNPHKTTAVGISQIRVIIQGEGFGCIILIKYISELHNFPFWSKLLKYSMKLK